MRDLHFARRLYPPRPHLPALSESSPTASPALPQPTTREAAVAERPIKPGPLCGRRPSRHCSPPVSALNGVAARKSRALNSSLLGTRYTVGTLDNVGAVAYLGGGAYV